MIYPVLVWRPLLRGCDTWIFDRPEEDASGSARARAHCVSRWGSPESRLEGPAPDAATS